MVITGFTAATIIVSMAENEPGNMPVPQHPEDRSQAITAADHTRSREGKRRFRYIPLALKAIVSVIIVLVFVVSGKQIAVLYQTASLEADAIRLVPDNQIGGPIMVGFGDAPYTIFRQEVDGDLATASIHLKTVCFNITKSSGYPSDLASSAEQNLLQTLLKKNQYSVGNVSVCALSPGTPTFVGIKSKPASSSNTNLLDRSRIVAWGFATQLASHRWKLQVVSYESPENVTGFGSMKVALPPDSQRLLHMDSPAGDSVMAFTSKSGINAQIEFFNQFFESNEWTQKNQWRVSQNDGHGTYTRMHNNRSQTIYIHLQRNQMNAERDNKTGQQEDWQGIISLARHLLRP